MITQNTFENIYEYLYNRGKLVGTRSRPNVVVSDMTDNIHSGVAFDVSGYTASLANGSSLIFLGKTGAKQVHFHGFNIVTSAGLATIEFFEGTTVSANGTAVSTPNKNRNSTTTATMQVYSGSTVTSNGTLLASRHILSVGGGAHIEGGEANVSSEWLLKPNTNYMFKITNSSGSAIALSASFYFYEKNV